MDPAKPRYASDTATRANGTQVQLALREMQGFLGRPRFWMIFAGVVVVVALAGPFYTLERLSFPARLLYWGGTGLGACLVLTFASILMHRLGDARGWPWLPGALAAGVLGVVPTMALVFAADLLSSPGEAAPLRFWALLPYVAFPVVVITVLINALARPMNVEAGAPSPPDDAPPTAPATPPETPPQAAPAASVLFAKLPAPLGRDIVSIQARDHYIEVTTPVGTALILMRLTDAERELAAVDGVRVHRSWWVNFAHVARLETGASGPQLRLTTGGLVPVARARRADVRARLAAKTARESPDLSPDFNSDAT